MIASEVKLFLMDDYGYTGDLNTKSSNGTYLQISNDEAQMISKQYYFTLDLKCQLKIKRSNKLYIKEKSKIEIVALVNSCWTRAMMTDDVLSSETIEQHYIGDIL